MSDRLAVILLFLGCVIALLVSWPLGVLLVLIGGAGLLL